jgi:hypothetical protein
MDNIRTRAQDMDIIMTKGAQDMDKISGEGCKTWHNIRTDVQDMDIISGQCRTWYVFVWI